MVNGVDELITYYHQVLEELRLRAERLASAELEIQMALSDLEQTENHHQPISKACELARKAQVKVEKLKMLKQLYVSLEEAKGDLEKAQQRKLDVLEELQEQGIPISKLEIE